MQRCCSGALEVGRKLCQQAFKKFANNDEEISDSDERNVSTQSADRTPESVDDESSSVVRLSRRSSLLVGILLHFFLLLKLSKKGRNERKDLKCSI
uniref:Uncharacterized protein n=1 Tax=Elaeophora elaphi TaxID=1147741 RepID=A0A0R3RKV3_9BILA